MANPLDLLNGAAPTRPRANVSGYVSTRQPAPASFTDQLWVIVPDYSLDTPVGPCQWAAINGSSLPAQGAAVLVTFDHNDVPVVTWWQATWTPAARPVTALPAQPVDGQEAYFQTQAMATGGIPPWYLRHRKLDPNGTTNPNTYKWEPVGGVVEMEQTTGTQSTASTTPVLLSGPSLTLPLAGDYDVTLMSRPYNTNFATGEADIILFAGGVSTGMTLIPYQGTAGGTTTLFAGNLARTVRLTNLAAGAVLDLRMAVNAASMTADYRTLRVRPVRVG